MEIIRHRAYARAGLIGNPSDGYHGKTISVIVRDFFAQVVLYEWEDVEIVRTEDSESRFSNVHALVRDVELHGYYGGIRLVKATIKKFVEFCDSRAIELHDRNFSVRYESNIPRQVGLAGSSAIIVATLRCLMDYYRVTIPLHVQPSLALSVETQELGIAGGLQDRVIQVYEGLVYMDFAPNRKREDCGLDCYHYERLDPALLPSVYIAYSVDQSGPTEVVHNDLRERFASGNPEVLAAMAQFAALTEQARSALLSGDVEQLSRAMDANFDTRRAIMPRLPAGQLRMIEVARSVGASAKFAGSGGAIIGVYRGEEMFDKLRAAMAQIHCEVIHPTVLAPTPAAGFAVASE